MSIRAPGVDSFPAPSASATDTATVMNPTCKSRSVWCGQEQSPLFGKIPPEIRNSIFSLALHEYDDPEQTYARDTYYTRPGFKARKKLDTSLLRTCQRIWEETQNVIWQNLEVTFFFGHSDRKPPEYIPEYDPENGPRKYVRSRIHILKRYWRFTPAQWSKVKHVRFMSYPMNALDKDTIFRMFFGDEPYFRHLRPESITFTLRYTDWGQWDTNGPPKMQLAWSHRTILDKEKELDVEIDRAVRWMYRFYERRDGMGLVISQSIQKWKWAGPTTFGDGKKFAHHGEGAEMWYIVKVLKWRLDEAAGVDPNALRHLDWTEQHFDDPGW